MKNGLFNAYRWVVHRLWNTGIGNRWPFEQIHYTIISWLRPAQVELDGHRILLDPTDGCRLSYAPEKTHGFEKDFLLQHIRPGDVVLDVGANIGYFTLLFARAVGPTGQVFAFEPDPSNARLLRCNLENNGYPNVTVCEVAISDHSGPARLYQSRTHGGTHRVYESAACGAAVEIKATTLDEWYASYRGRVSLIKIDIEGSEPMAIRGGLRLLERNPQAALFTEFYPTALREAGAAPAEYLDQLGRLGFSIYHLDQKGQQVCRAAIGCLLEQCPLGSNLVTNLWCVRDQAKGECCSASTVRSP